MLEYLNSSALVINAIHARESETSGPYAQHFCSNIIICVVQCEETRYATLTKSSMKIVLNRKSLGSEIVDILSTNESFLFFICDIYCSSRGGGVIAIMTRHN